MVGGGRVTRERGDTTSQVTSVAYLLGVTVQRESDVLLAADFFCRHRLPPFKGKKMMKRVRRGRVGR